jgi:hypothetical protein
MAEELSFEGELNVLLNRQPFEPFALTAASGERFEVGDPDEIVVGPVAVMLIRPQGGNVVIRTRQLVAIHSS